MVGVGLMNSISTWGKCQVVAIYMYLKSGKGPHVVVSFQILFNQTNDTAQREVVRVYTATAIELTWTTLFHDPC